MGKPPAASISGGVLCITTGTALFSRRTRFSARSAVHDLYGLQEGVAGEAGSVLLLRLSCRRLSRRSGVYRVDPASFSRTDRFQTDQPQAEETPIGVSGARRKFQDFLERIDGRRVKRNYPGVRGVSYLSVHLGFGPLCIRELMRTATSLQNGGADTWLCELIWGDFHFGILHLFPHVVEPAFRPEFEVRRFSNSQANCGAWCEARSGMPLVDAAMRQLNGAGYMHHRLHMVARRSWSRICAWICAWIGVGVSPL